jgi:hypothetical protein
VAQQERERVDRRMRQHEQPRARGAGQQAAGQRERRHDEAYERYRHRVGERADERHLAEQQQRERHEPRRHGPLRASRQQQRPAPARGRRPDPAVPREQDHRDRTERQPEAGPQHGPRIEQHDDAERRAQYMRHRREAPGPQRDGDDGQHVQRALRRHAETGQQHVRQRGAGAGQRRHLLRRQQQRQAGIGEERAAPQGRRRPGGHPGDHRDVQARDRNQVADAGVVEDSPVGLVDAALVADDQRDDDARIRPRPERGQDTRPQRRPGRFDERAGAPHERIEQAIAVTCAHVTGGAHALLQQPRFVIEAARIRVAVRTLQAHRELPALAGLDVANRLPAAARAAQGRVPRQRDMRWHGDGGIEAAFDVQVEAHAAVEAVRQAVHKADDGHVAAFVGARQLLVPRSRAQQRGPGCAEQRAGDADRDRADDRLTVHARAQGQQG